MSADDKWWFLNEQGKQFAETVSKAKAECLRQHAELKKKRQDGDATDEDMKTMAEVVRLHNELEGKLEELRSLNPMLVQNILKHLK